MSLRQFFGTCTLGAYLLLIGFLGGTVVSAIRFDQRRAVILSQLDDASTRVRAKLMLFEHDASRFAAIHPNDAARAR